MSSIRHVIVTGALSVVKGMEADLVCSDSKEFRMLHSQFLGDLTRSW